MEIPFCCDRYSALIFDSFDCRHRVVDTTPDTDVICSIDFEDSGLFSKKIYFLRLRFERNVDFTPSVHVLQLDHAKTYTSLSPP